MTAASSRGPYAKSGARRAAIVEAAREVFALRGYRAGTLQEIAELAGMGQSALLHHFATKQALLLAVLRDRDERGDDPAVSGDIAAAVLDQARENERAPGIVELYTVLAGEAATRHHPARDYFVERFTRVRGQYEAELSALADAGALRPGVDPAAAAAGLVALWDGVQQQWLIGVPGTDVTAVLRHHLALLFTDEARPAALDP